MMFCGVPGLSLECSRPWEAPICRIILARVSERRGAPPAGVPLAGAKRPPFSPPPPGAKREKGGGRPGGRGGGGRGGGGGAFLALASPSPPPLSPAGPLGVGSRLQRDRGGE